MIVEHLALAGVIKPEDQTALALELWRYLFGNTDPFTSGTTIAELDAECSYCERKYGITIERTPLYANETQMRSSWDADDQADFVHIIDSCRTVDYSNDMFTVAQLINAAVALENGDRNAQIGWVLKTNGVTTTPIALRLDVLMPWLGLPIDGHFVTVH